MECSILSKLRDTAGQGSPGNQGKVPEFFWAGKVRVSKEIVKVGEFREGAL